MRTCRRVKRGIRPLIIKRSTAAMRLHTVTTTMHEGQPAHLKKHFNLVRLIAQGLE
jgi:hypothetical protein